VDIAEALPALNSPDKWDSNDGNTGLHYQITRNMSDVKLQISESIMMILSDTLEFALELCQFITLDYQKWKFREHTKKDAWK
jgi:hypothetical protein